GAEVQLSHACTTWFKESWNYTYLENLGIPAGLDHYVPLAFSPRHTVNWIATLTPAKRWKIDTAARYENARFEGNNETGAKLGSEVMGDVRLAYQLRQLEIYLGVNDVMDKRYEEQPGFPLPGRTVYFGLNLLLWE